MRLLIRCLDQSPNICRRLIFNLITTAAPETLPNHTTNAVLAILKKTFSSNKLDPSHAVIYTKYLLLIIEHYFQRHSANIQSLWKSQRKHPRWNSVIFKHSNKQIAPHDIRPNPSNGIRNTIHIDWLLLMLEKCDLSIQKPRSVTPKVRDEVVQGERSKSYIQLSTLSDGFTNWDLWFLISRIYTVHLT